MASLTSSKAVSHKLAEGFMVTVVFGVVALLLNIKIYTAPSEFYSASQLIQGYGSWVKVTQLSLPGYNSYPGLGAASSTNLPLIIFDLPLQFFFWITGSLSLGFRTFLFVENLLMFLGSYYFLKKLLRIQSIAALAGTLSFAVYPLGINSMAEGLGAYQIAIPSFLGSLNYAVNFLESRRLRSLILFSVFTFFSGLLPSTFLLEYISILSYVPFALSRHELLGSTRKVLIVLLELTAASFFSIAYWSVPSLYTIFVKPSSGGFLYALSSGQVQTLLSQKFAYFPPNNLIGMDYGLVLYRDVHGYVSPALKSYIAYISYSLEPAIICFSLSALLFIQQKRKWALYFASTYLIAASLFAGANTPGLLLFLMRILYIPFVVLRSSLNAYPLLYISIAALMALTVDGLMKNSKVRLASRRNVKSMLSVSLVLVIITAEFAALVPLFRSGDFFDSSPPVRIPSYYDEVVQYLKPQLNSGFFRIAIPGLPGIYSVSWVPNNFWETSFFEFLGVPFIDEFILQPMPEIAGSAFSLLDSNKWSTTGNVNFNQTALLRLLGLMSVKYVAVQYDINGINQSNAFSPEAMGAKLGTSGINFGLVTLYRNPLFVPLVYSPNYLVLVDNSSGSYIRTASNSALSNNAEVAFTNNKYVFDYFLDHGSVLLGNNMLQIGAATIRNYTMDNATYSSVRATLLTSGDPFLLVFNTNFDPDFKLSVAGGHLLEHLRLNSYANAWIIEPTQPDLKVAISYEIPVVSFLAISPFPSFLVIMLVIEIIVWFHRDKINWMSFISY